ncbi:hypothetical protein H632_c1354p0 [Helicosporidium sp. ATCC 50920]|nr:hypothetical protein H632_c1354p0 [Helicosporidium sp. ATCC 50920]|eukprot:KDD74381.1 hypothetical protein H632_c1354p0 [Helicosporidium sp. ATCC 50920]
MGQRSRNRPAGKSTFPLPPGGVPRHLIKYHRDPQYWMAKFPRSCAFWAAPTELAIGGQRTTKLGVRHPVAGVILVSHLLLDERAIEEARREVQSGLEGRLGGEAALPGPVYFERLCRIEEDAFLAARSRHDDVADQHRVDGDRDAVETYAWLLKSRDAGARPFLPSEANARDVVLSASLLSRCGVCPPCRAPPQCAALALLPCWRETLSRALDFGHRYTAAPLRYKGEQLQNRIISYVLHAEAMAPCVRGPGQGLKYGLSNRPMAVGEKRLPKWLKLAEGGAMDSHSFIYPVLPPILLEGDVMPEMQVWVQAPQRRLWAMEHESAVYPLTWLERTYDWRRERWAMMDLGWAWGAFGLPPPPSEPDDLHGPVRWDPTLSLVEVLGYVPHRRLLDSFSRQPSTRRWVAELRGWPGAPPWEPPRLIRCKYCGTKHAMYTLLKTINGNCPLHRVVWGGRQLLVEDVQLWEANRAHTCALRKGQLKPANTSAERAPGEEVEVVAVTLPPNAKIPPPPKRRTNLVAASYLRGGKRFLFELREHGRLFVPDPATSRCSR